LPETVFLHPVNAKDVKNNITIIIIIASILNVLPFCPL
jgi:hypothetical protein